MTSLVLNNWALSYKILIIGIWMFLVLFWMIINRYMHMSHIWQIFLSWRSSSNGFLFWLANVQADICHIERGNSWVMFPLPVKQFQLNWTVFFLMMLPVMWLMPKLPICYKIIKRCLHWNQRNILNQILFLGWLSDIFFFFFFLIAVYNFYWLQWEPFDLTINFK